MERFDFGRAEEELDWLDQILRDPVHPLYKEAKIRRDEIVEQGIAHMRNVSIARLFSEQPWNQ